MQLLIVGATVLVPEPTLNKPVQWDSRMQHGCRYRQYALYSIQGCFDQREYAQVIATLVGLEYIHSWFRKHDDEAACVSERVFERPNQPGKVQELTLVVSCASASSSSRCTLH